MTFSTDSLRFRFVASMIAATVAGLILTGFMVTYLMRTYVTQGFHEEMQIHIDELGALTTVNETGQPYLLRALSDPRFGAQNSGLYWEVRRKGFAALRSPSLAMNDLSGTMATTQNKHWAITRGPKGDTLEYGKTEPARDHGPPLELSIATDMTVVEATLDDFTGPLAWTLIGFAAMMAALGSAQVFYGLRPLKRATLAIAQIRDGKQTAMVGKYPSEIRPLVNDINGFLEANATIVRSARVQAGNLAHGLRTPLAIIMDEAERLSDAGHKKSADSVLRQIDQMQRQIEYHLARVRSAAMIPTPGRIASLRAVVDPIRQAMVRLHGEREIAICCGSFPDLILACDDVDLGEMLSSLLDNACKWAKARVMLSWHAEDGVAQIMIDDDGAGIAPPIREHVFSIGERLDDATPGHGLGLSIVRNLVRIYGGDVVLEDSPLGGLRARIMLPLDGNGHSPASG